MYIYIYIYILKHVLAAAMARHQCFLTTGRHLGCVWCFYVRNLHSNIGYSHTKNAKSINVNKMKSSRRTTCVCVCVCVSWSLCVCACVLLGRNRMTYPKLQQLEVGESQNYPRKITADKTVTSSGLLWWIKQTPDSWRQREPANWEDLGHLQDIKLVEWINPAQVNTWLH